MNVMRLIKRLLEAPNTNAPVKYMDSKGEAVEIKSIYLDKEGVILDGENE